MHVARKLIRTFGFDLVRVLKEETGTKGFPEDFSEIDVETYRRVSDFTMTSKERIFAAIRAH